jgi:hypothetical protein
MLSELVITVTLAIVMLYMAYTTLRKFITLWREENKVLALEKEDMYISISLSPRR